MSQIKGTNELIDQFGKNIHLASSLLYDAKLFSHLLVIIYSAIDSMGLLEAPVSQNSATRDSFKNWTKKYLLKNGTFNFNETDLYAARCAVLHSFTSKSGLSNSGEAKELTYYSAPPDSPQAKAFISVADTISPGKYAPVHIGFLYLAFLKSMPLFLEELKISCTKDTTYENRVNNVLQQHTM